MVWGLSVRTAGVVLHHEGRYVFQLGFDRTGLALGVARLGGHIEPAESPEECARREVAEEACVEVQLVAPPRTFVYDVDRTPLELDFCAWAEEGHPPLFVSRQLSTGEGSLTYLASTAGEPSPGAETQALVFLTPEEVTRVSAGGLDLGTFLACGGLATGTEDLPRQLEMRPRGQLLALAVLLGGGGLAENTSTS